MIESSKIYDLQNVDGGGRDERCERCGRGGRRGRGCV
jgi:hypothetical protein